MPSLVSFGSLGDFFEVFVFFSMKKGYFEGEEDREERAHQDYRMGKVRAKSRLGRKVEGKDVPFVS